MVVQGQVAEQGRSLNPGGGSTRVKISYIQDVILLTLNLSVSQLIYWIILILLFLFLTLAKHVGKAYHTKLVRIIKKIYHHDF